MIIASYSSLKDYNECKRKVYYRITKEPRPETASMIAGSTVHRMIEEAHTGDWLGTDEYIKRMVTRLSSGNVKFYRGQKVPNLIRHVEMCFANYIELSDKLPPMYGCEVPFDIEYHPDVKVVGKFDQIRGDANTIIELKSTVKKPTNEFLATDMQSTIYTWAFEEMYGVTPTFLHVHLPSGTVYKLVRKDYSDFIGIMSDYIRDRDERNFPRQPDGYKCARCDYYDSCIKSEDGNGEVVLLSRAHYSFKNNSVVHKFAEV